MFIIVGRIHPAHISSIDYDTQVAIVEWCENELSKGKEIDLSEIESLNPNLLMPSFQNQRSQKNSQQIQQVNLKKKLVPLKHVFY